jgi:drug/metabolite transporter (DMT)-like permease
MIEAVMLLVTVALTVVAQLLWKARALAHAADAGSGAMDRYFAGMLLDPWIWTAMGCTGLGMISWMLVLRRMDLSLAFPALALVYLIIPIAAHFVFREALPPLRIVGLLLILVGVAMTAVSA